MNCAGENDDMLWHYIFTIQSIHERNNITEYWTHAYKSDAF